ncbi:hypothetical protein BBJ28_00008731 [Nothophytophthora sp. Chile5]|nr:hypothetical protein BBJ28_00008731 [Nothophytophthora sp. Chile5]
MDAVWDRFQTAYSRKSHGLMVDDDHVGKLSQPLMSSSEGEDSPDEELGGLLQPSSNMRPHYEESAAARRKRRRRKDDEDLGEVSRRFAVSAEPLKLLRSVGTWMVSLSAAVSVFAPNNNSSALPASLSTQMLTPRRKMENMEDVSERALARLAMLTVGFSLLLLLTVYWQAS